MFKVLAAVLAAVFLVTTEAGALAENIAGREAFQEGLRLRENGALLEAENAVLSALSENPANAEYHFELANIYAARFDQWKKTPYHPRAQEWLNRAAYQLEQAAMIDPGFIAAIFNLGVVYKKRREHEKARAQFKKVLELDRASVAAWMQIGAIYEDQGFFNEARDSYEQAREIDFYNPDIKSAIEDLRENEERYLEYQRRADASRYSAIERSFRYQSFAADKYDPNRLRSDQSGLGALAAAPYLAAMLVQQFMNFKAANEVEDY